MYTTRFALVLSLTLLTSLAANAAAAQDAAFASNSWSVPFPAPVPEALSQPLADERAPLRRVRVGLVYTRSTPTYAYSWITGGDGNRTEYKDEIAATHGAHATVEVPLVPALSVGARAGFRSWSIDSERALGFSGHTTYDLGALVVVRIPWLWSMSLETGGMRLLAMTGLSVDSLGWDDSRVTTSLSARPGWHAGGGLGFEFLIAGRVALTADLLYVHRQTRVHFDVPNGAAGSLNYRTHELSLALGVMVLL